MIIQHLAYNYDRAALVCPACGGEATNTAIRHEDDCPEMARLVAAAVEAERAKVTALRAVIQHVLDDEESRPGGWGPDVTAVGWLRKAMEATR